MEVFTVFSQDSVQHRLLEQISSRSPTFQFPIVSSVSQFGVSFVSGEVAHHVCRHGHTVDGNSGAEYGDTPPVFICMKADNTKRASVCGYGEDCASALRVSGARMLETQPTFVQSSVVDNKGLVF